MAIDPHPSTAVVDDVQTAAVTLGRSLSPLVLVVVILGVGFLGAGLLIASLYAPTGKDATYVTGFVITVIGPALLGLVAAVRADHAARVGNANAVSLATATQAIEKVQADVNGHLSEHVAQTTKALEVAAQVTSVAEQAGIVARAPGTRTRADDPPAIPAQSGDLAPLADQS